MKVEKGWEQGTVENEMVALGLLHYQQGAEEIMWLQVSGEHHSKWPFPWRM